MFKTSSEFTMTGSRMSIPLEGAGTLEVVYDPRWEGGKWTAVTDEHVITCGEGETPLEAVISALARVLNVVGIMNEAYRRDQAEIAELGAEVSALCEECVDRADCEQSLTHMLLEDSDRADKAEAILAALREPSEAVSIALHETLEDMTGTGLTHYAAGVLIRAAVAAAEREVGDAAL